MIETAAKLIALFDRRERLYLAVLFAAVVVMAFLQLGSIAAVLPFLSVVADPAQIQQNPWLAWAYGTLGFTTTNKFLVGLGVLALAALVISNAWMAATQWALYRFVRGRAHSLSMKLMTHYLAQPYVWFLRRNSSDLGKNVLAEVEQAMNTVLLPGLQAASRAIVALSIMGLLLVFDPVLALVVSVVLAAFAVVWLAVRHRLTRLGSARFAANTARYTAANEAFGAIKEVKLMGRERAFLARLNGPSYRLNRSIASSQIIGELPRYALEVVAFGGVLVIAVTLLLRGGGLQQVIPVLGLYVFAGYRLMPMLQQIFHCAAQLRFGSPALAHLHHELTSRPGPPALPAGDAAPQPLALTDKLVLDAVTFTYPGADKSALRDVSLVIEADTTVGIMGATGSGKTTLVDIILGLLAPEGGQVLVDGTALDETNLRAWQAGLGYVPQHIWLADDTVAANIAFGVAPGDIDRDAVERAARLAQVHNFVSGELPEGYDTLVGERGVRLSGGQRQRIGIARALYHDPAVLVFDEATSALDNDTEAAVMAAVDRLSGTRTILLIAHRLTTLEGCDLVFRVEAGQVTGEAVELARAAVR